MKAKQIRFIIIFCVLFLIASIMNAHAAPSVYRNRVSWSQAAGQMATITFEDQANRYYNSFTIQSVTFDSPVGRQESDTLRVIGPGNSPVIPGITSYVLVGYYGGNVIHGKLNSTTTAVGADVFDLWQGTQITVTVHWVEQNGATGSQSYILDQIATNSSYFFGVTIDNGQITDITFDATGAVQGWVAVDNFSYSTIQATQAPFPGFIGNQNFTTGQPNFYTFTLSQPTSMGILSTGDMDLKGALYQLQVNGSATELVLVADLDNPTDNVSHGYTDITNKAHKNFMMRPGQWVNYTTQWTEPCGTITATKYRQLASGTYYLKVEPDDAGSEEGTYGLLFLKKPASNNEFFDSLTYLLGDNDLTNDYLDIYFRALYPEIYDQNINWSYTIDNGGVPAARQCKALVNVYLMYVLGTCRLQPDGVGKAKGILDWFPLNTPESVFLRGGSIIYNNSPKIDFRNITDAQRGDVFIRGNIRGDCIKYNRQGRCAEYIYYNHYGLYFDNYNNSRYIIDANWDGPGRIAINQGEGSRFDINWWKIGRPEFR